MARLNFQHIASFKARSPDDLLLSRAELEQLTGFQRPKRMAAWLEERGWVFEPAKRAGDIPKVDRQYYAARMSGQATGPRRVGPRLDFMLRP